MEGYSFASWLLAAVLGRVLEIDLVVPEYAAGSAAMRAQSWWSAYRARRPGATVLVRPQSPVVRDCFPARLGGAPFDALTCILPRGMVIVLMGVSGSGKTTLGYASRGDWGLRSSTRTISIRPSR